MKEVSISRLCSTQTHTLTTLLSTPVALSNTNKELEGISQRLSRYLCHCVFHVWAQLGLGKLFLLSVYGKRDPETEWWKSRPSDEA